MEKSKVSEEFGPTSLRLSKHDSLPLGEMACLICYKEDTSLCAAGVMHASKTAVDNRAIVNIKTMVIALNNKPILTKLSSGDVISNELNY